MSGLGGSLARIGVWPARANDWLDRRRAILCLGILLIIEIVSWAGVIFNLLNTKTLVYSPDFGTFYSAGTLAAAGHPALAYDHAAEFAAEQANAGMPVTGITNIGHFNYPPVFLLFCLGLAKFSFFHAMVIFAVATLAFYLLVARAIVAQRGWTIFVPFLAFPPVFWNLYSGQNGLLTAALFGAATLLIDRRPVIAGLLFGALCYKPQMGLLIPVALAAGRHWRAFAAASATVAALCLASLLVFGWSAWRAFLDNLPTARATYDTGAIAFKGFLTPFGAVRLLGGSPGMSYVVQAAATILAAIFVAWTWRRGLPLAARAAALVSATLVAFPTIFYYDLILNGIAAAWLFREADRIDVGRYEKIVMATLLLLLVYAMRLADWIPVAAVIVWVLTAVVVVRVLRARVVS